MNQIHNIIRSLLGKTRSPTILEIGCHQGSDTIKLIENNLRDGSYYGFEPDPRNYELLIKNLEYLKNYNIDLRLYKIAMSDQHGEADFHLSSDPEGHNASSSLNKPTKHLEVFPNVTFNEIIKVKTTTLDFFCHVNHIFHIDFLWCDSQGSEYKIIQGEKTY